MFLLTRRGNEVFFLVSGLNDKGRKVQYKGVRERGKFEVRVFQLRIPRLGDGDLL